MNRYLEFIFEYSFCYRYLYITETDEWYVCSKEFPHVYNVITDRLIWGNVYRSIHDSGISNTIPKFSCVIIMIRVVKLYKGS